MSKGEKLVSQCNALYKRFQDESKVLPAGDKQITVWSGKIVETTLDVGIPYGSYGACIRALTYLGCIETIQSGARNNPTVIILHAEPTETLWAGYDDSSAQALTKKTRSATLTAEAERIIMSLGGVDVGKVLKNHEDRITALESLSNQRETKNG